MPTANWNDLIPEIFASSKWFIMEHQAFIMIGTAIAIGMAVLQMIVNLLDRSNNKDDDDDGFDYY